MPSHYAHYRFGMAILETLPADIRRCIQRFRRLYDVGLHGPDIFYFYNPLGTGATGTLGIKFHEQTGRSFFTRACRAIRMENNEAAAAYLYGVLCHYVLDSVMHPVLLEMAKNVGVSHAALETEFDRYLLQHDDRFPPDPKRLTQHLNLTNGECDTVARFYPPASSKTVKRAVNNDAYMVRLLTTTEGIGRNVLTAGIRILGKDLQDMLMTSQPNPKCAHLNEALEEQYQQALDRFPEYLRQMHAHMTYSAPLEEEYTAPFA